MENFATFERLATICRFTSLQERRFRGYLRGNVLLVVDLFMTRFTAAIRRLYKPSVSVKQLNYFSLPPDKASLSLSFYLSRAEAKLSQTI
jgi:hypothetical protein